MAETRPTSVRGRAEFVDGKLADMSFTRGARTTTGVVVGKTSVSQMISRYRSAGYSASSRYDSTFAGTYVTVKRHGRIVLGGFATKTIVENLAIPQIPVCE